MSKQAAPAAPAAAAAPNQPQTAASDKVYEYDEAKVEQLFDGKPWMKNIKHFNKCRISALAAMKMLRHSLAGVDKGRKNGTNPIEVMGLCIGKPEGDTIIIMDTYPLPVEGTETACIVDDAMNNLLINLGESLEQRRKDKFVGWYHSHPFDVETYSHCHLSATDVQTQFVWQQALPAWVGIVVDPLRSLAKQEPEFGCFRCYPLNHEPPKQECPDGSMVPDEKARQVRWGVTHHRYYSLDISYFNSSIGNNVLDTLSRNNLWIRVLGSSSIMEQENRERFSDRVKKAATKIESAAAHVHSHFSHGNTRKAANEELSQASQACAELALEQAKGHIVQVSKHVLFDGSAPAPPAPAKDGPAAMSS